MSDHIQEIQSILDSNKEAMTDGLYLELSNIAAKIYTEKKESEGLYIFSFVIQTEIEYNNKTINTQDKGADISGMRKTPAMTITDFVHIYLRNQDEHDEFISYINAKLEDCNKFHLPDPAAHIFEEGIVSMDDTLMISSSYVYVLKVKRVTIQSSV